MSDKAFKAEEGTVNVDLSEKKRMLWVAVAQRVLTTTTVPYHQLWPSLPRIRKRGNYYGKPIDAR